ncbi:MAG: YeeE/YedE family protein [Saprospiraceae bacterium]|nr:YeeE/YedE family protein [Saprospiraceae bacterium]
MRSLLILLIGIIFGFTFVKGEIISWFRMVEMFQFTSFHMYGVIGTGVIVGIIAMQIIKRFDIRTLDGSPITYEKKKFTKGTVIGGLMFGLGWGITGACPGPIFVQIGSGFLAVVVTLLFAVFGTWVYGAVRDRLPH